MEGQVADSDPARTGAGEREATAQHPGNGEDAGPDHGEVRDLAERLRGQGVVLVASRSLTNTRSEGLDLLGALPVLARELAELWRDAADTLPVLDVDRLQLRSAAAVLMQGAVYAEQDGERIRPLDAQALARAVSLRQDLQGPPAPGADADADVANTLLDRTWAVLCDLRRLAADGSDADEIGEQPAVVPSATRVDAGAEDARLGPALHRAACAGALVGLLAPWLGPVRSGALAQVDALLEGVSTIARRPHDHDWWVALITAGRVAASLSVAGAHAAARYAGAPKDVLALTLSEPALSLLHDQALATLTKVIGSAGTEEAGVPAEPGAPQASPSQQARAAAERAAAERRATQQASMERQQAMRAARQEQAAGVTGAIPLPAGPSSGDWFGPAGDPGQAGHGGGTHEGGLIDIGAVEQGVRDAVAKSAAGEHALIEDEPGEVPLKIWDALMRPRH